MHIRRSSRSLALSALSTVLALALVACGSDRGGAGRPDGSVQLQTVEHARGETPVPVDPQRVVVLEPVQLDTAVALGTVPVGAALLSEATGVPDYLGTAAAGVASVGTVSEPSLERIAALEPDLVLGTEARHSALYDPLSSIAPTVFIASGSDPWIDNVALVGRALGGEPEAQALLDGYRDRCAEIAETYGTAGQTAQLIRPRDSVLSLYGPTSFAGSTLECAGFTTPPRDWEDSISVELSPELVLEARADYVFLTAVDPTDETAIPPAVTAVGAEAFPQLHLVDQSFWISGVGPLGGMAVLDDIERILSAQAGPR